LVQTGERSWDLPGAHVPSGEVVADALASKFLLQFRLTIEALSLLDSRFLSASDPEKQIITCGCQFGAPVDIIRLGSGYTQAQFVSLRDLWSWPVDAKSRSSIIAWAPLGDCPRDMRGPRHVLPQISARSRISAGPEIRLNRKAEGVIA
jgi:hypothetical protein